MKARVYIPDEKKYLDLSNEEFISTDGKKLAIFWNLEFEDRQTVETELATDVFVGNHELYENDVVMLSNNYFGIVVFKQGQFNVACATTIEELMTLRQNSVSNENDYCAFMSLLKVELKKYVGDIHTLEEKSRM